MFHNDQPQDMVYINHTIDEIHKNINADMLVGFLPFPRRSADTG